ncbi:MAG: o-succinylbenzoate synthase [Pseudoclavibacter sp.]|nr:o-succinylbenzoate synthase [Pseudoclavibacter sp.]
MPPPPASRPAPPPLEELLADAHVVRLPMRLRFRGIEEREAVLLRGPAGWAEFSPFPEYGDREASAWLAAAIESGWDRTLPRLREGRVRVNATVPAVPARRVPEVLARFGDCRTIKVKVAERGQGLDEDLARLAAVRRAAPEARLRVDANAAWDEERAERALTAFAPFGLEYAEQPVAGVAAMARLRARLRDRGVGVPIAADESVRRARDPLAVARAGAADVLVVKVQPLGGVRRALELVREAGLPATVSSALDTSVGIAAGAQLAAHIARELDGGVQRYDAGLGTASLLAADVAVRPLRPQDGELPLEAVEVDEQALRRSAAPPERAAWWQRRLARCHALLADPEGTSVPED